MHAFVLPASFPPQSPSGSRFEAKRYLGRGLRGGEGPLPLSPFPQSALPPPQVSGRAADEERKTWKWEVILSSRDDFLTSSPGASLSALKPAETKSGREFLTALQQFLGRHPELAGDQRWLEILRYCYQHYVNYDPQLRDLPVSDKLEAAARMAVEFSGALAGPRP